MKDIRKYLPALFLTIAILVGWQAYVASGLISQRILPSPSLIFGALFDAKALIADHALVTSVEVLVGFIISVSFAVIVATAIFLSNPVKKALYPLLVASQTIPIIALAPLLLIWFGFGIVPKIIVVVIYSFFPIAVALADGLSSTPKNLVDYMKSQGATRWQILRLVNYPAALDKFFIGLKIGAVYAVTGAVVGEFVGAYKGLGVYLQSSAYSYATAQVFATILVVMAIAFVLIGSIFLIQKITMPWKRSANA